MANRYTLVPESWLQQENKHSLPEEKQAKFSDLPELLPKNMRSKARVLVHYLENGGVAVNDMQRIVYDDGEVGSHMLDLLRYGLSRFSKSRPLDWPKFQELLNKLGAPKSAVVKRGSIISDWKTY